MRSSDEGESALLSPPLGEVLTPTQGGKEAAVVPSVSPETGGRPGSGRQRSAAIPASSQTRSFRLRHFPEVPAQIWNDWRWQLRARFRTGEALARVIELSDAEIEALIHTHRRLPLSVTPYYASLIDPVDPNHPIRRATVPVAAEGLKSYGEADDPLSEEAMCPVHGLVHRYPDRVLFLVTDTCSVSCRYCTRSRVVNQGDLRPNIDRWNAAIDYIERTPAVRDVLISGGDPLTMIDERIEYLLRKLRHIRHVEIIRIGTKVPMVLPQRITPELTKMLRRYHPLFISIHAMHPSELTVEATTACERLADAGIPLGSQTVLLKGINDDVGVMKRLMHGLLKVRVRPYYIYQCDPITGSAHFRTSVARGLEIIEGLRGHTTGYAVPQYVIDAPGGGGKIPLLPGYFVGREGNDVVLRNYEGNTYRYPDLV
jgi:lysine 2,3-aminomutase